MALRYTLGKDERLKRKQHIETLFRTGKAFSVFPLRVIWLLAPATGPSASKAGFSVPKKRFKHATDRNRVKRLLREAWRLQKHNLQPLVPEGQELHVFLIFTDGVLPGLPQISDSLGKCMGKLRSALDSAGEKKVYV